MDTATLLIILIIGLAGYMTLVPHGRRYTRRGYTRARSYYSTRRRSSRRRYY